MKHNGLIWFLVIFIIFGLCVASNEVAGEQNNDCPSGQKYIMGKCR